jgi:type IV secretion system protein TrbB
VSALVAGAATLTEVRRQAVLRTAVAPIAGYLDDDAVIEVMLNAGVGLVATPARMGPEDALRMLRVVATEMNAELGERNPSMAGKLPIWGMRVQASIPPVVEAPVFALRKPARLIFRLDDYVRQGVLTEGEAEALGAAVRERRNVLVGGGTGSGKTTFANALLAEVAKTTDRVYLVEDNAELQCAAPNKVQVLVRPPVYAWNRAIVDAMRFRPDRIIVGEVRDGSALEMLKAWNTGHPGGIATVHANGTTAMLDRVCQLIEEIVPVAPRALVAETINLCVHLRRDAGHPAGRSLTGLDEVVAVGEGARWQLRSLRKP